MGRETYFFAPPPGSLGRGQKVKYHLISITKSISKIFIPYFVCVLTYERYKTYQTVFFILSPGSCPRGGTWGYLGAKIKIRPSVCPLCYLLLSHWTKLNQISCVSYAHEWGVQRIFFGPAPWGPGEGSKGQISFNFNYKVNFNFFIPYFVCVLTNERYKTYQTGFSFCRLGHALGVGLGGT